MRWLQLSAVAAAAFVPTVLGASPALLQVDDFADLAMVTELQDPFRGPEFNRWRSLAMPGGYALYGAGAAARLARPPWEDDPARADGFRYAEYAPDADSRVWMSAGYAFAAVVARAFINHSWPADVRGAQTDYIGGGLVTDLPIEPFRTDSGHAWVRPPLDIVFSDRVEAALVEAGLMPLSALPYGEEAVFSAVRSLQAPATYIGATAAAANANARLSVQINSMLCVSRFAHYIKVIGRDMVGSFRTAEEVEAQLQGWLVSYVNTSLSAGPEMRARYPLVEARVTVRERPGRPGVYGCVVLLQPHFQLDDVTASFRLVTDLAAPGAAGLKETPPMPETQQTAGELFRAGNLNGAIAAANAEVRRKPGDLGGRVLLAELLIFAGNLERADTILDAASQADPSGAIVVAEFRQLLRADLARRQFARDGARPRVSRRADRTVARRLGGAGGAARRRYRRSRGPRRRSRGAPAARAGQPEAAKAVRSPLTIFATSTISAPDFSRC